MKFIVTFFTNVVKWRNQINHFGVYPYNTYSGKLKRTISMQCSQIMLYEPNNSESQSSCCQLNNNYAYILATQPLNHILWRGNGWGWGGRQRVVS